MSGSGTGRVKMLKLVGLFKHWTLTKKQHFFYSYGCLKYFVGIRNFLLLLYFFCLHRTQKVRVLWNTLRPRAHAPVVRSYSPEPLLEIFLILVSSNLKLGRNFVNQKSCCAAVGPQWPQNKVLKVLEEIHGWNFFVFLHEVRAT